MVNGMMELGSGMVERVERDGGGSKVVGGKEWWSCMMIVKMTDHITCL